MKLTPWDGSAGPSTLKPFILYFSILICLCMWGPNLETKYNGYKSQPADQRIHQLSSEYQQWGGFRQPFDLCLSRVVPRAAPPTGWHWGSRLWVLLTDGRLRPQLLGLSSCGYQPEKYFSSFSLTRLSQNHCPPCCCAHLV